MNIGTKNTAKVYLDTNVAVDLVTKAEPFYREAEFIEVLARAGSIDVLISAGTVTTMIYLVVNRYKVSNANDVLIEFFKTCHVLSTEKATVLEAMQSDFIDKEDAYQYYTALEHDADYFLTRDMKDFKSVVPYHLPVLTPLQFEYMLL